MRRVDTTRTTAKRPRLARNKLSPPGPRTVAETSREPSFCDGDYQPTAANPYPTNPLQPLPLKGCALR